MLARVISVALCAAAIWTTPASADCTATNCIPGGGSVSKDCFAEFTGTGLLLNAPPFDPTLPVPKKKKEVRCFDGDAGCDNDGVVDGSCQFNVDVCLFNTDPSLPSCTPAVVTDATVLAKAAPGEAAALQAAVLGLPAGTAVCTAGQSITVPLKVTGSGALRKAKAVVKVKATTAAGTDSDVLRLRCLPRRWPSHGYDRTNHRASGQETEITPGNASQLALLWDFPLTKGVTSTPTVSDKLVYVTSWDGKVYALGRKSGSLQWTYDTGSFSVSGVQSSATLTADGRLLVGDSAATIHCLDAKTGKLLWQRSVGNAAVDHLWSSPTVANNRVFAGIASHNDVPCTQGRLVALDLDTGVELWTRETVPDKICDNDTAVACTVDAECGTGTCVDAKGAGVTATVSVDRTGAYLYMNTVGCFTFPSVGDSDTIFKLDAATGATIWKKRVNAPEQFGSCSNDASIDCGSDAVCGVGTCVTKTFYHDFGFLNGPILADVDLGSGPEPLVMSGSKNGTLYALGETDGSTKWTNPVLPLPVTPSFAGFGLFNGAIGFSGGRLFASLYQFVPTSMPAPDHLQAFDANGGASVWTDDIGASWGSIGIANGVLFVGTNTTPVLYAYDLGTGARLATLALPTTTTSGASIVEGIVYVGYGVSSAGGVRAYALP